jgi:hypothetical protein
MANDEREPTYGDMMRGVCSIASFICLGFQIVTPFDSLAYPIILIVFGSFASLRAFLPGAKTWEVMNLLVGIGLIAMGLVTLSKFL